MSDILNKILKHYIDLELYANGVADDIEELLYELYSECDKAVLGIKHLNTKSDYNKVRYVVEDYLNDFEKRLKSRLEEEADLIRVKESAFIKSIYGITASVSLSRILFTPFDKKDTVSSFVERSSKNIMRTYDSALRSGYIFGQEPNELEINTKVVTKGIENGIITSVPSFAKTTDKIIFIKNNTEVIWVSVLDGSSCLLCDSLSGTRYKSASDAPVYPHEKCRCMLVKADEVTTPIPTFQEYIEGLTDEEQYQVLGKNRYNLYKNYEIPLGKFVNDGRVLRLDEIQE